jgi:hypothetical protein
LTLFSFRLFEVVVSAARAIGITTTITTKEMHSLVARIREKRTGVGRGATAFFLWAMSIKKWRVFFVDKDTRVLVWSLSFSGPTQKECHDMRSLSSFVYRDPAKRDIDTIKS